MDKDLMTVSQYMILDNDQINTEALISMLEFIGKCAFKVFSSPSQLLEALKYDKPDVIFCNITARGCDARELCYKKEITAPIIFISVLNKSEERRNCFLKSGHPYVTSPLTPEMIEEHL
jgi:CheY-like chemotaxis protein